MRQKEQEKILSDLRDAIQRILLNGFKNRMQRLVDSVEQIQIQNYKVIQDENDRDILSIDEVRIGARVFVVFGHDAKSSDNIILKNQKPLVFRYNNEIDNFELNEDTAIFFDAT